MSPSALRPPVIAVFGSSTVTEHEPAWRAAHTLGAELAQRGYVTMTGGYDGAMAATSRGAREAGGHVIGVTVELFERRGPVNPWVSERVHTPDLFERLRHLTHEADGYVVATGSIGTLTELFLVWTMVAVNGREPAPIVLMGDHWRAWLELHRSPGFIPERLHPFVEVADTPAEAAAAVARGLDRVRTSCTSVPGSPA
jgi:hypothetical protein